MKKQINPLRYDPTRTATYRKWFVAGLRKAFNQLKRDILNLLVVEDTFGLKPVDTNLLNEYAKSYSLASTQVNVTDPKMLSVWKAVQDTISPPDVVRLEDEPHITIRYGLLDLPSQIQNVRNLASEFGPIKVRVTGLSVFDVPGKGDVLKFDVESDDLHRLNSRLGLLPNKSDYPIYKPHMTVAYVSSGRGEYYAALSKGVVGTEMVFDHFQYSEMDGTKSRIELVAPTVTTNRRWAYASQSEAVDNFERWLDDRIKRTVTSPAEAERWRRYITRGFERGVNRAHVDTRGISKTAGNNLPTGFTETERERFVRTTISKATASEKLRLLRMRSLQDVQGMSADLKNKARRTLTDGLVRGLSPREIGAKLVKVLDISLARASLIARTELVRAHADGQLEAMEQLGVTHVGVAVEWSVRAGACPMCVPMKGVVLKMSEARGMIPRHPGCYCAWVPANVFESPEEKRDQKRTQRQIKSAIKKSKKEDAEDSDWEPSEPIAKSRPKQVTNTAPCTCSPNLLALARIIANLEE